MKSLKLRGVCGGAVQNNDPDICLFGRDIKINHNTIERYFIGVGCNRMRDLMIISSMVKYADRLCTRTVSNGWGRRFDIDVPVSEVGFWGSATIKRGLSSLLYMLTGDDWVFQFHERTEERYNLVQDCFCFDDPTAIITYSDSLDSFAYAGFFDHKDHERFYSSKPMLALVTISERKRNTDSARHEGNRSEMSRRVAVPFELKEEKRRLREPSLRSRAFSVLSVAAACASVARQDKVFIGENGQGVLAPWMLPMANETPDVRSNPVFTRCFSRFMSYVLECEVDFVHPRIKSTKAGTLLDTLSCSPASLNGWQDTVSCPLNRSMNAGGSKLNCGICAACLLRRQSLFVAGLGCDEEKYYWRENSRGEFEHVADDGTVKQISPTHSRYLAAGVAIMTDFAALSKNGGLSRSQIFRVEQLARSLNESAETTATWVRSLIGRHAEEWNYFLDMLPTGSSIRWLANRWR